MIVTVTLNPCIDQTVFVDGLKLHDANRVVRFETDAGGKGVNLSRVVAELGGESVATGLLGGGPGAFVRRVLDAQGVRHEFVEIEKDTRTNFTVEDGSGEAPTSFNAKGPMVAEFEWDALVDKVRTIATGASWVTLGGSLPQGVPVDAYLTLGWIAKELGAKLALDADGEAARQGLEAKPDFIKPNKKEAGRLLGRAVESVEDAVFAAEELLQYLSEGGICIVSLGAEGAVLATREETFIGKPIEIESNSTIGSGDSMVAGVLLSLVQGKPLREAFALGIAAGTATAMTDGAEIARRSVVDELLAKVQIESAH
jgi:1-phosphofructokinase family hexose kinase